MTEELKSRINQANNFFEHILSHESVVPAWRDLGTWARSRGYIP